MLDSCSGRLFAHGHAGRFTAESDCAFLTTVLAATTQPLVLVQDGARSHTAKDTQAFFAAHAARLTVYQLPAYAPDDTPIEHLWRAIKRTHTHNRSCPSFATLTEAVEAALAYFQAHPAQVTQLVGTFLDHMAAHAAPPATPSETLPLAA